ncbi:MAG: hypothetical protein RBR38_02970 [Desulfomicrobium apsheronum]|nr:hypothetical protein [Desulfomicrobium apsheronum]
MTHEQRLNWWLRIDDGQEFSPCDHVIPAQAGIHASSGANPSPFQASSLGRWPGIFALRPRHSRAGGNPCFIRHEPFALPGIFPWSLARNFRPATTSFQRRRESMLHPTRTLRPSGHLPLVDEQEFSPCDHVIPAQAGIYASSDMNPSSLRASSLGR